jgi:hypothetical protein
MRPNVAVVVIAAALIVAAGIAVNGGLYQVVGAGPESGYLVQRWTGQAWYLTRGVLRPVRPAPPDVEKNYGK